MNHKEFTMPSGAVLKITLAPFPVSKALYQAIMEELRSVKIDETEEVGVNLFKDLFCMGFSSKKIDAAIAECLKRVTYNDEKITVDTFEPEVARGDYLIVCLKVVEENLAPFTKNLYAEFSRLKNLVGVIPA